MKFALITLALFAGSVFAAPKVDNPGGFAEYYCGDLSAGHFLGAPASASGDEASVQACAGRFAMASAVMSYGTGVKFLGLAKTLPGGDDRLPAYIFNLKSKDGVVHRMLIQMWADLSKNAPDGYPAIVLTKTFEEEM